jgi:ADP-ribose pyrophosphatase YjhB (NUDIX family)
VTPDVPIPRDNGPDRDSVSSQLRVLIERNHRPFELPHGHAPAAIESARSRLAPSPQGPVWELVLSAPEGPGELPLVTVEPDPVSSLAPDAWGAVKPVPRVRPGSYALLVRRRPAGEEVLLTKLSGERGAWTLPGGGLDPGEAPEAGAGREVHEETGLEFRADVLLGVVSTRFIGHAATGRLEDFQLLGLVYTGRVDEESAPHVVEVGGSTSDARWIPAGELGETFLTPLAVTALELWGPRR